MKIKHLHLLVCLIFLMTFIGGCSNQDNDNRETVEGSDINYTKVKTTTPLDQTVSNEAKKLLANKNSISGVRAVNTDKKLFVALEITQFDRLQLKKIEKETKETLKKKYPNMQHEVSTDKKIYIELDELEKKLQQKKIKMKDLNQEIKSIKKKMNDKA
ncbi:hypothetical protein NC797_04605 [Aquibacillus sp. 3ASR75-11]|uniref:Sporulation lipoprotein YhcN/YlaJ n=1 Tax=Terrihalobacillus insolitus TaxID=2950438 RepID=A0A9X4ALH9_9BACI|nr:hypothetical protein [Terrihalobacillus insolitus]MDC3412734.1 hypothetical protein [Terrihalobacillus insolitus]MDC3423789.1 hypothetical protein [Terrihalobacillus insolitus]